MGKALIFSAPSGAGKTTIVRHLLEHFDDLAFSISATTRGKRPLEEHGRDYYFLSVGEFKSRIEREDFVEWEEVYDNLFYGTLKEEVNRIWSEGKVVVFDVDVVGGVNLKKYFGNQALSIFVKPPSIEALKDRLEKRQTETAESLKKRVDKAAREMTYAVDFDQVLENDKLDIALKEAEEVVNEYIKA